MFVQVKLLQGYQKSLTYKVPESWDNNNLVGSIITVPLKNKVVPALVISTCKYLPEQVSYVIKEAVAKDVLPPDKYYSSFIKNISSFYFSPQKLFYNRIRKFVHTKELAPRGQNPGGQHTSQARSSNIQKIELTNEQQTVVDYTNPIITNPTYSPTLLHGVTGSGKTEIYKKIISHSVEQNKSVIFLLPEVSLSMQFEQIFLRQLPSNIPVFSFHSATRVKDKKLLWQNLLEKKPCLIVGVHLPVMLPIANLGCIIVDEEHELGFQEKKHPKINSKEIAIWRAKHYNIPIILGSATPSINSLHNTSKHGWKLFKLTKRFSGSFPAIKTVPITKQANGQKNSFRKNFWITKELESAIADRLLKKEQILIYLNRRGYSFFVQCKKCGHTFLCPNCSVSLTLHKGADKVHKLCCHYCDYKQDNPTSCSECKAGSKELLKRGIGTQQIVTILQDLFPHAKIARADLDTTKKKRLWGETVEKFENGEIDILVGTQTITKGYHFPRVTLVGIIWADLNVHFPVFNAAETTLQKLIQVAGRAGRQSENSLVIAQIMHDHPIFNYLNEENYLEFCKEEMGFRKETCYPPYGRFVQIEIKHVDSKKIDHDTQEIFNVLHRACEQHKLDVSILGPSKPLIYRIQKTEIRHIFLKAKSFKEIYFLLNSLYKNFPQSIQSTVFVVPT